MSSHREDKQEELKVCNWTFMRRRIKDKCKGVSQREVLWELFVAFRTHILPHIHSELFRHWSSWRVSSDPAVAPDFSVRPISEALKWSLHDLCRTEDGAVVTDMCLSVFFLVKRKQVIAKKRRGEKLKGNVQEEKWLPFLGVFSLEKFRNSKGRMTNAQKTERTS